MFKTSIKKPSWNEIKLFDLTEIRRGASPRPIQDFISSDGMPWLKIADVANTSRVVFITKEKIKKEGVSKSVTVNAGDLILSNSATPAIPKFMGITACIHDGWLLLKPRDNVDKMFLYYLLLNERPKLIHSASGSVFKNLKTDIVKNHIVICPNLSEQKEIASILSSLDDKIELLQKQNETLEKIAQTIFHEWFVEFNFPNEKGEPYKASGGKMIESELGEMPEGWEVSNLGKETKIIYGKNLPTNKLVYKGYPVFGGNGQIGWHTDYIYEYPQVLVSCRGEASGRVNISLPKSFVTNNSLILEIPDNSPLNFNYLKNWSLKNEYYEYVTGSAQPQITIQTLSIAPLLLPNDKTLKLFEELAKSLTDKSLKNSYQINELSKIRDTLLPKLMNGELTLKI